jgi:hypothetical protein
MTLIEERTNKASEIWKDHENYQAYLSTKGLTQNIPKWNDLYEGRHWKAPTETTKGMPRLNMPMTKMIVNNKVANILSGNVEVKFVAGGKDNQDKSKELTRFAKHQCKEMGMEAIDFDVITHERINGVGAKYYPWIEEAIGRKGRYKGAVRCQEIDALCFEVADPTEKDVQKQKWVQFPIREEVSRVKKMCDSKELLDKIVPDDLETNYADKVEMEGSQLCTVFTRYFKKDGEVYFLKATKTVVLTEDTPLNPILVKRLKKEKEKEEKKSQEGQDIIIQDGKGTSTPDEKLEKNNWDREDYYMATLYPIEIFSLDPSRNSIIGLSEVQDIAVTQNIINIAVAMGAINLLQQGAPKVIADKQALGEQKLNNEPGQMIYNMTPQKPVKEVFDVVPAQPFTAGALEFAPTLIDLTRSLTNSTEFITGDDIGKNVSGITVRLMQERSMQPIKMQQKRYWQHKEREGKILEQFYKLYYENEEYAYEYSSAEKVAELEKSGTLLTDGYGVFNGEDYQDITFYVEATQVAQFNDVMQLDIINTCLQMGAIDIDTYFELLPDSLSAIRDKYKEVTFIKKQTQLSQALELSQEQAQTIEGLNTEADEREKVIKRKDILLNELMKQVAMFTKPNNPTPQAN